LRRIGERARSIQRGGSVGERGTDPQLHCRLWVGGLVPAEQQAPHHLEEGGSESGEASPAVVVQQPDTRVERGDGTQALCDRNLSERVLVDVARVRAGAAPARTGLFTRVPVARSVVVEELLDIVEEERVAIEVQDLREPATGQVVKRQDLVEQRAE